MPVKTWTPLPLIKTTAAFFGEKGIDSPRLDAELLLCHVLGLESRIDLYTGFERPLTTEEVDAYRELVRRRASREPVSHILGYREFMGIRFTVTPDVLAPRPETEILVEEAVRLIQVTGPESRVEGRTSVLDLGTGSGCIAVSVAALCPQATVVATDISAAALSVAGENGERAGVAERVTLREGDLFDACEAGVAFDLVLVNPPYVAEGDAAVAPEVRDFEPHVAVYSGDDGLAVHRRIAAAVETWLNPGGYLLLEVGAGQADNVAALLNQETLLGPICTLADHAGIDRVVVAARPRP